MKKIFTTLVAAFAVLAASAQYVCTEQGTVLTLKTASQGEDGKPVEVETTTTIVEVTTGDNGNITVKSEQKTPLPGGFGESTEYEYCYYNPADGTTTVIIADPEETRNTVAQMIKMSADEAGQNVSLSDIKEMIRVSGDIKLELNPATAEGTKIPNQTLRINIATETMKLNLWEGVYCGSEQVTVPAGTFDCLKVHYVQNQQMGQNRSKLTVEAWYAPNIGLVRSISTDKKGTEITRTELTQVKKP